MAVSSVLRQIRTRVVPMTSEPRRFVGFFGLVLVLVGLLGILPRTGSAAVKSKQSAILDLSQTILVCNLPTGQLCSVNCQGLTLPKSYPTWPINNVVQVRIFAASAGYVMQIESPLQNDPTHKSTYVFLYGPQQVCVFENMKAEGT